MEASPKPTPPKPAEGNVLSTVHIRRMTDAFVAIEHPKDWTEEQVRAELTARAMDFAQAAPMWSAESRTTMGRVYLDDFDPDVIEAKPFLLSAGEAESMGMDEEEG